MAITDHPAPHLAASRRADQVMRAFRRVAWQRIELHADGSGKSVVVGHRHRHEGNLVVDLDTALELQRRGVRTVVRREV